MTFSYSNREHKLTSNLTIGVTNPAKIYKVGRHEVLVYENGEVTCRQPYGYQGDPKQVLPNLEICDGQIRIAMEDLIDEILARIEPEELAVSLWANDEVKERFMDALAERYSHSNVDDKDRRKFLDKVKEQIHDKALDGLHSSMAKMEYTISTHWSCWKVIREANQYLEAIDCRKADGALYRIDDPTRSGQFSIGGATWNEARDHWRHEIKQQLGWKA